MDACNVSPPGCLLSSSARALCLSQQARPARFFHHVRQAVGTNASDGCERRDGLDSLYLAGCHLMRRATGRGPKCPMCTVMCHVGHARLRVAGLDWTTTINRRDAILDRTKFVDSDQKPLTPVHFRSCVSLYSVRLVSQSPRSNPCTGKPFNTHTPGNQDWCRAVLTIHRCAVAAGVTPKTQRDV
ncbi:hypothetical protein NM208_g3450 [Fusarium decemcellulare]|uniref:Uncharacterized protein n=1 Tax=Fusarium decemcellulare TaxID=57161 RepID=A0ACC1SNY1_9HYPO|nr:hypothetical protein NM208_g3450 [Fusarium decemcellulare]